MSLTAFNNKVIELEKAVKRSKVRSIRKLTRQIEHERKKNPDDERSARKIKRIVDEIHHLRKLSNKDVVLFAMENEGTIAEVLQKCKPPSDDIKQHALIRLATEKSLQADLTSLKTGDDFTKSWQQLLIMYQSRHEKRLAWKEKSADFEKIEQALVEQQKELDEIEEKLPKPLKAKKKKKEKVVIPRSKETVVCVLDLEKKTAKPFGKRPIEVKEDKVVAKEPAEPEVSSQTHLITETVLSTPEGAAPVINDPFFLNSQHQISYQKRSAQDKDDAELDDRAFIEHSYFINALSSSSNRRDGAGDVARKKWAHLSAPTARPRPSTKRPLTTDRFNGSQETSRSKAMKTDDAPLHPSWEASKQAKSQYSIKKSQAKKIVFNHSDDEAT